MNVKFLLFSVDIVKKKWKSLRDNFRVEMKKVPIGKSGDAGLPIDQYLSKWPYFKMMFFLRDSMVGRKMSGNLTAAATAMTSPAPISTFDREPNTNQCASTIPFLQSRSERTDVALEEEFPQENNTAKPRPHEKVRNKRKRSRDQMENEPEALIAIEKEKVEIEKQKLQLLQQDNERREREENDSDRHFLLSLLPMLRKVPEREKTNVEIRFKQVLHEAVYRNSTESVIYRPWKN